MGRPDVAAAGNLNILAAGDPIAIERARPLFDAIGQRTWLLGVEPHEANVAKLAINFLLASAIEATAEAATLAERHEIDPAKLMEVITGTLFAAPAYATYGKLIIEGEFKPGFKLTLGLKDMRLALAAGEAMGVPLPFASVVRDNLVDAIGHGDAGRDWSALALLRAGERGSATPRGSNDRATEDHNRAVERTAQQAPLRTTARLSQEGDLLLHQRRCFRHASRQSTQPRRHN